MLGITGKVFFSINSLFFLVIFPLFSSAQVYFPPEALSNPQNHKHLFDKVFVYSEIGVFNKSRYSDAVILENGYAESKIKNPESWTNIQNKEAFQIDLVFTKYPWNKTDWLTNYYDLLAKRIDQLFKIDPALNSSKIQWNLVLQTDCKTEAETKNYFHGIVIRYRGSEPIHEIPNAGESISSEKAILKVSSFMDYLGGTRDASVFYAFNIIKKNGNAAVVMDWTNSMHVHSAQAILWHLKKLQDSGIKYFTFFNDGNRIPDEQKKIGSTGGIYPIEAENVDSLIFLMEHVMQQGNGGDWPENDLEAVITTINHFKDLNEIYLIADNNSGVRDYGLLYQIKIPVNVIVCDARDMINIQYINIAYKTGGDIFVDGQQIDSIAGETDDKGRFMVLKHMYKFDENDNIVPCLEIDRFYFERKAFEERTSKDNKKKIKHKQPGCPQF
ncbi:MAG: hypothetical protein JXR58_01210 [Bacteroidales bacterium]|nr:hypothetical protein [Bacteroidales bacterium]